MKPITQMTEDEITQEFIETFDKLNEKNKQHVRNGLKVSEGGMIHSMEQAKSVLLIMRLMYAQQILVEVASKSLHGE